MHIQYPKHLPCRYLQISNATLWLEAADGSRQFTFRLWLPPLNGRLLLLDQRDGGRRRVLDFGDSFRTDDILAHRFSHHFLAFLLTNVFFADFSMNILAKRLPVGTGLFWWPKVNSEIRAAVRH
jgi:hypothetical protein